MSQTMEIEENGLDYRNKIRTKEFKTAISEVTSIFQRVLREKQDVQDRLAEFDKDAEIQELREENHILKQNALCILSDTARERNWEFALKHSEFCGTKRYVYDLESTKLGVIVRVSCPVCGEVAELTDIRDADGLAHWGQPHLK